MSAHRTDINVTPLIDIVLVLLIIFIVMVPALMKSAAVALPALNQPPGNGKPPEALVLRLDATGRLRLQQEEIALAALAERLAPAFRLQPLQARKVCLKVEGETPQQKVVDVLDQVRVASDRAKRMTAADPAIRNEGFDAKVVIAMDKKDS